MTRNKSSNPVVVTDADAISRAATEIRKLAGGENLTTNAILNALSRAFFKDPHRNWGTLKNSASPIIGKGVNPSFATNSTSQLPPLPKNHGNYFSIEIEWAHNDSEQGTYGWSGYAKDFAEAEYKTRLEMAQSHIEDHLENYSEDEIDEYYSNVENGKDNFGSVTWSSEGANIWQASSAYKTLEKCLSDAHDMNPADLVAHLGAGIVKAMENLRPETPPSDDETSDPTPFVIKNHIEPGIVQGGGDGEFASIAFWIAPGENTGHLITYRDGPNPIEGSVEISQYGKSHHIWVPEKDEIDDIVERLQKTLKGAVRPDGQIPIPLREEIEQILSSVPLAEITYSDWLKENDEETYHDLYGPTYHIASGRFYGDNETSIGIYSDVSKTQVRDLFVKEFGPDEDDLERIRKEYGDPDTHGLWEDLFVIHSSFTPIS